MADQFSDVANRTGQTLEWAFRKLVVKIAGGCRWFEIEYGDGF